MTPISIGFLELEQRTFTIEDAVFYGADPAATMTEAAERAQGLIE